MKVNPRSNQPNKTGLRTKWTCLVFAKRKVLAQKENEAEVFEKQLKIFV